MRALKAAVIVMAVLIVAGVVVVVATIAQRVAGGTAGSAPAHAVQALLDEPEGTRIASVATSPDRLAVHLQGGGPDRVVVVDTRAGRVVARVSLAK